MLLGWMKLSSGTTDYKKNTLSKTTEHRLYFKHTSALKPPKFCWETLGSGLYVAAEDLDTLQLLLATGSPVVLLLPDCKWYSGTRWQLWPGLQSPWFPICPSIHKRNTEAWLEWRSQPVKCETQSSQSRSPVPKGWQDTLCLCRRPAIPNTNLISNEKALTGETQWWTSLPQMWDMSSFCVFLLQTVTTAKSEIRVQHRRESLTLCASVAHMTLFPCLEQSTWGYAN